MSSPQTRPATLQELPELRRKTESISKLLSEQLNGHLETLRPLFAPDRVFGKLAGGKVEVTGAERAFAELQQSYKPFTAKPYDLPANVETNWLSLVGQALTTEPWEYEITLQGRPVTMSSPVKWALVYHSNLTLAQAKRAVLNPEPGYLDRLRQFTVNALVLEKLLGRSPKLIALFADLGWEVKTETTSELKGLPLVTATYILASYRPPDELISAAIAFSGVRAFIELIDLEAARSPKTALALRIDEVLQS
jgi:hypothetical protein